MDPDQSPPPPPPPPSPLVSLLHGVYEERGRRTTMEDTHYITDQFGAMLAAARLASHVARSPSSSSPPFAAAASYFGLFDGHAGIGAAEFCARHLHENIARSAAVADTLEDAMVQGFLETDRAYLARASAAQEESGSCCMTLVACGTRLTIAHTGDVRAVLCRDGAAVLLTRDHKPSSVAERVRIEQLGGFVAFEMLNGVLEVSRAIGDFDRDVGSKTRGLHATPEINIVELGPGDEFVIVACDGLWDVIESGDAIAFARAHLLQYGSVEAASKALVDEALRRHSDDNITAIVVGFRRYRPPPDPDHAGVDHPAETDDDEAAAMATTTDDDDDDDDDVASASADGAIRPRMCRAALIKVRHLLG